jgi:hypothetical protein
MRRGPRLKPHEQWARGVIAKEPGQSVEVHDERISSS